MASSENNHNKTELKGREEIKLLVTLFYSRIRKDEMLGPIFNKQVTHWESHLNLITDFWESQLFLNRKYTGNPITAHNKTDENTGYGITMEHFGQWLNIWFQTLDDYFTGENVWILKNRARKMSTMLYLNMFKARNSN